MNQTYSNLEILLIDDGSTDRSPAMCDEWAEKDRRIKVIHKDNGGAGLARNAGLDIATGEYIGFVDSDDYIAPEMYEKLYTLMTQNNADIGMCSFFVVDESGNIAGTNQEAKLLSSEEALHELVYSRDVGLIYLWNKLHKSELYDGVRFPAGNRNDDTSRIHRLFGSCRSLTVSEERLYYHRARLGSVMGKLSGSKLTEADIKDWQDKREAFRDRYKYLASIGMNELSEFARLRSYMYAVMVLVLQKVNYLQYRKDISCFIGCGPLKLMIILFSSRKSELMKRAVKLALVWFRSIFRPYVKYVPLTDKENE